MRNVRFRILTLVLGLLAFVGGSSHLHGQQYVELIKFTNTWKYNQSGANLGTAWIAPNYDDTQAGWQSGPALLAVEDSNPFPAGYNQATIFPNTIPTPLSLTSGGGTNGTNITYYFRTKFTNTLTSVTGVELFATNLVDDGCVIYLNGFRVGDVRLANASPNYLTFASAGPTVEGQSDVVSIPINRLLAPNSVNTMAVEVHQSGIGSSDIALAMKLVAIVATPLTISSQPQSLTAAVGENVALTIGVSGGPVSYRWFRTGSSTVLSTSNSLPFVNVQLSSSGNYYCVVTNTLTPPLTSSVVTLTVVQDVFGPEPVTAVVLESGITNIIDITFDEALLSTSAEARNTNNFRLFVSGTTNQFIAIQANVQFSGSTHVILRVASNQNWVIGGNYYLVLNNIPDARGNMIAPNSVVGISWNDRRILSDMGDVWNVYDCADPIFCDPDFAAVYANEAWTKTNYVMTPVWGSGSAGGIYAHDTELTETNFCAGDNLGQTISWQLEPTLFRRTIFVTSSVPVAVQLRLRHMIDDGLVLYLNGERIYSFNAPAGAVSISTRASTVVGNALCTNISSLVSATLRPGTNWLAAAVLNGGTDVDTIFGLEIEGVLLRTSPTPSLANTNLLRITQTKLPNGNSVLSWPVSITQTSGFYGFNLLWCSNFDAGPNFPGGPLRYPRANQVTNQSNPYTNSGGTRFIRLGRPN